MKKIIFFLVSFFYFFNAHAQDYFGFWGMVHRGLPNAMPEAMESSNLIFIQAWEPEDLIDEVIQYNVSHGYTPDSIHAKKIMLDVQELFLYGTYDLLWPVYENQELVELCHQHKVDPTDIRNICSLTELEAAGIEDTDLETGSMQTVAAWNSLASFLNGTVTGIGNGQYKRIDYIKTFYFYDEPYWGAATRTIDADGLRRGSTVKYDAPMPQEYMKAALEIVGDIIKLEFPDTLLSVNFAYPAVDGTRPFNPPENYDWFSFACYDGTYERCGLFYNSNLSIEAFYENLRVAVQRTHGAKKIFLIPPTSTLDRLQNGDVYERIDEQARMGWMEKYRDLAESRSDIVAVMGFLWQRELNEAPGGNGQIFYGAAGTYDLRTAYLKWFDEVLADDVSVNPQCTVEIEEPNPENLSHVTAKYTCDSAKSAIFECYLDTVQLPGCDSETKHKLNGLSYGDHTFIVKAKYPQSGYSQASVSWTREAPPEVPILDQSRLPKIYSNDTQPKFYFSSSNAQSYECNVNGKIESCSSPYNARYRVREGKNTFQVRAVGRGEDRSEWTELFSWVKDTVKPKINGVTLKSHVAIDKSQLTFSIAENGSGIAEIRCVHNIHTNDQWASCNNPFVFTHAPVQGAVKNWVRIRVYDKAGNFSEDYTDNWLTPRILINIDAREDNANAQGQTKFTFSVAQKPLEILRLECIHQGTWSQCGTTHYVTPAPVGSWNWFAVRAVDEFGNPHPETIGSWITQ